ncbi:hypothetical protein CEXT_346551 [Caerostris extrusa]|uniref:Maturase n=1 Tax=Caerostris extrusa TaxID=172846 RepID=A0AAV4NY84_CAEEX|nr:hypothetical protein CEXT_346551 [Caerostris extrusa]
MLRFVNAKSVILIDLLSMEEVENAAVHWTCAGRVRPLKHPASFVLGRGRINALFQKEYYLLSSKLLSQLPPTPNKNSTLQPPHLLTRRYDDSSHNAKWREDFKSNSSSRTIRLEEFLHLIATWSKNVHGILIQPASRETMNLSSSFANGPLPVITCLAWRERGKSVAFASRMEVLIKWPGILNPKLDSNLSSLPEINASFVGVLKSECRPRSPILPEVLIVFLCPLTACPSSRSTSCYVPLHHPSIPATPEHHYRGLLSSSPPPHPPPPNPSKNGVPCNRIFGRTKHHYRGLLSSAPLVHPVPPPKSLKNGVPCNWISGTSELGC